MTKLKEFKVGDTVKVIKACDGKCCGMTGVVVAKTNVWGSGVVTVSFEGWKAGHSGSLGGDRKDCWNFHEAFKQLKVVAPKEIEKVKSPIAPKKKPSQAYLGNGKHAWEVVVGGGDFGTSPKTERLRVPGGWLYKPRASAPVFVPMPEVVKHKV
jgi:hypothetical protein